MTEIPNTVGPINTIEFSIYIIFSKDDQEVTSTVIHLGRLEQELRCWETMGMLKVEPLSKLSMAEIYPVD